VCGLKKAEFLGGSGFGEGVAEKVSNGMMMVKKKGESGYYRDKKDDIKEPFSW